MKALTLKVAIVAVSALLLGSVAVRPTLAQSSGGSSSGGTGGPSQGTNNPGPQSAPQAPSNTQGTTGCCSNGSSPG